MLLLDTKLVVMLGFVTQLISVLVMFLVLAGLFVALIIARAFTPWIQAQLSGSPIPFLQIVGFVFRKSDPGIIINCYAKARDAGIDVSPAQIETQALAGGRPARVLQAIIEANTLGVDLNWVTSCAIDLAGRDPVDFTRVSAETGCNLFEYAEHVPSSRSASTEDSAS